MNEVLAKQLIGLLIDAATAEARRTFPPYIQSSWLEALSDLLEKGLYHVWVSLLKDMDIVRLEAGVVSIIDNRDKDDGPT